MKNFRTIAALSLFALGSVAAHAQSSGAFGDNSNYPAAASTASALTRQRVPMAACPTMQKVLTWPTALPP